MRIFKFIFFVFVCNASIIAMAQNDVIQFTHIGKGDRIRNLSISLNDYSISENSDSVELFNSLFLKKVKLNYDEFTYLLEYVKSNNSHKLSEDPFGKVEICVTYIDNKQQTDYDLEQPSDVADYLEGLTLWIKKNAKSSPNLEEVKDVLESW